MSLQTVIVTLYLHARPIDMMRSPASGSDWVLMCRTDLLCSGRVQHGEAWRERAEGIKKSARVCETET